MTLSYLSLFSGIGGLDLGLDRAGWTCVGQVEKDPFCQRVLARHWPEVPKHDDITTAVTWWRSLPRPHVDAVVGGYPCQGESQAGRRRAQDDERWLWPEMARVIHAVQPRYVIGENVLGHRTRGLRFVLRDLDRLGYTACAGVIEAREMGAPHIRRRILTVAERPDVADTLSVTWKTRWSGHSEQGTQRRDAHRGGLAGDVADSIGTRRDSGGWLEPAWTSALGTGWWAAEPDVGRVAHGVPARVDRLRALGNAVVPQVAEHIGRLILAAHANTSVAA